MAAIPPGGQHVDLDGITRAASREAGDVPPDLLGDYLAAVLAAARTGRRLSGTELAGYRAAGERAAEGGVALRGLVDLYLSATWRLWRDLPGTGQPVTALRAAGLAVLRGADDAVAAAAEGFERAHLSVARRQEAERLEFFEDLLSGRGGFASLTVRGERVGLRLAGPQQVVLAAVSGPEASHPLAGQAGGAHPDSGHPDIRLLLPPGADVERAVAAAAAPAPSLTATRGGRLVAITGAADGNEASRVAGALAHALSATQAALPGANPGTPTIRAPAGPHGKTAPSARRPWRIAIGRAYPGPGGVLRSYADAADALTVADRLGLADPIADAARLLVYQVLFRDQAALADLVGALLGPLDRARGGAGPLVNTLAAYYSCGQVTAAAARLLHLSVRAVSYRLARVRELTGQDPADPAQALSLQVAVVGARLLGWPSAPHGPG